MPRVGIALGSNLGDRLANIQAARVYLQEFSLKSEPFLKSATYQTEPKHCPPGSPYFYNSVVEIGFHGTPSQLLEITQSIEEKLGRSINPIFNAPRTIDVDLLYFGTEIITTCSLILPHPRLRERRFVLQPLAEIRADLILPGFQMTVQDLLTRLPADEPPLVSIDFP